MKIIFLDPHHLQKNHENLDYSALKQLGELIFLENHNLDQLIPLLKTADILVVLKTKLPADLLQQLTNLKLICKAGTGYDNIDVQAAKTLGISVTNFPGYGAEIVAQWTISLLLALSTNILNYANAVKNNEWLQSQFLYPVISIRNKILGIIGYGHIGKQVAQLGNALGMKILVNTNYPDQTEFIKFVDKETIYQTSDFLSLHCYLTHATKSMINVDVLAKMKPSSFLINTSRAGLVDKSSLLNALQQNQIAGAAIDGYWQEPPTDDDSLIKLKNLIITPHMAWAALETRQMLINHIAERIKKFIHGEKIYVIS